MGIREDFSARSDDFSNQNDLTLGFSDTLSCSYATKLLMA